MTGPAPVPFPPLGNPRLTVVAVADLSHDPVFERLREQGVDELPGPCRALSGEFDGWISAFVRTANDQSYRFDLRSLHGQDGPQILTIERGHDVPDLEGVCAGRERGTTKLVVLVGIHGDATCKVRVDGLDHEAELAAGLVVIWPAFLSAHVDVLEGESLVALTTTVHGPAFR